MSQCIEHSSCANLEALKTGRVATIGAPHDDHPQVVGMARYATGEGTDVLRKGDNIPLISELAAPLC